MSENLITVSHELWIRCPREQVFQFTQDYTKRTLWDGGVISAEVIASGPERIVKIRAAGNTTMVFVYKQYDPPRRTSLAAREVQSPLIESGGGAWTYEEKDGGTLWTQTNSLKLKKTLAAVLLRSVVRWSMRRQTVKSMERAKRMLEEGNL